MVHLRLLPVFFIALGSATAFADYTITNRMEILGTVDPSVITNGYQNVSVVSQSANITTIDVTYDPYYLPPALVPDMNWQIDDLSMSDYLKPGLTANWDESFRQQLLKDLLAARIDPSKLSDVDVVKQVSTWLAQNFMNPGPFVPYFVEFQNGQPVVPSSTRAAFDAEKQKFGLNSDQDAFDRGLFGKGIYQNKSASSCTPSAILWTTVFRALGIPTRIIVNTPAVDPNDLSQILAAEAAIHDPQIQRRTFLGFSNLVANGSGGWDAHTFNEVYVGGRWTRLNYSMLDQQIVDVYYMGLLTEVKQVGDWSDSGLVGTWGARADQAEITASQSLVPVLSSQNPYRSLGISDSIGVTAAPDVKITATPVQAWLPNDPAMPSWMKSQFQPARAGITQVMISISEPVVDSDFVPLRVFSMYASSHLIMKIPGQPDLVANGFGPRVYSNASNPYGYIIDFPVDSSQIASGTLLQILAPTDNNANMPWIFPNPLQLKVP